ncbi:MAG TPA: hypothetical protein VMG81_06940 [Thermoplasmata archaeon]|nr:hypothetical protein [Thermoplasmata archaeon]
MENVDAQRIAAEPLPPEPVRPIDLGRRCLGAVRLPLAGPYRPWARLVRGSDGRLVWLVRLWEHDRPVVRLVETETLRAYARASRLPALAAALDALLARAGSAEEP